ncbi:aminotransferase class I/II-fold pyridoxal phosphate-dependent enzyme [Amniculibacterium sp. G2-70]|uniref:aminotransferase class I/II-fold pyridoxal phosphate-dependent enzyme n=1 Tax=Amniculibacterium sp. G2-70 TaxID=2767188 RepID=UPI0016543E1B|nr:aminotransferase class I/II-fold pyridoxal phosphate-dependent enzyme [Amniculibacterium sp. G2-70]
MKFRKRHSAGKVNIYTEIAELANQHFAVNLSQGSPDFHPDPRLQNFLIEAADQNLFQYASVSELPILTENLIKFNKKRNHPLELSENELAVIPGATYGIHLALATFLEPEDEVIVIEPCYETYAPAIEIRGAVPVYFQMEENYSIDWDKLKSLIRKKTKGIIVNSPSNPTGKVWKKEDWDQLWEVIKNTDILVVSDEVYDLLCYDHREFYSARLHPEIKNRSFSVFSFEKMFHISGWKASYITGTEKFMSAFKDLHQYLSFNINVYSQYALAKYLEVFDAEEHRKFYQSKRNFFYHLLEELPFDLDPKVEGGYFQTVGFKNIKPYMSDLEFSKWLIETIKVAPIPYSAFYHDHIDTGKIRLCFAKHEDTIVQAVENLKKI